MGKQGAELEALIIVEENRLVVWTRIHRLMVDQTRVQNENMRDYLLIPKTIQSIALILATIKAKQEEIKIIVNKYQLQTEPPGEEKQYQAQETSTFDSSQELLDSSEVLDATEARMSRSSTIGAVGLKKKFNWAMKDMKNFKKYLEELRDLNNELYNWTMPSLHALMYDAVTSALPKLQATASLESRVAALEIYTQTGSLHTSGKEELEAQIEAWKMEARREETGNSHSIPISSFSGLPSYANNDPRQRCEVQFNLLNTRVQKTVIEWRSYNRKFLADDVRKRLNGLVSLLKSTPKSLINVLTPLGLFEDSRLTDGRGTATTWFGIAYEMPKLATERTTVTMKSLKDLIERPEEPSDPKLQRRKRFPAPPLGQRFRLARRLSETLLSIHNCGWLHKGIRPENIVFFTNPGVDFNMPYLLGWEYSRKDAAGEQTETVITADKNAMLYQHPDNVERQYYRPEFDQYQLGCMLLEIAYWESLSYLRAKSTYQYNPTSEEWRNTLIKHAKLLKRDMGEIYSAIVVSLLQGLVFEERIGDFWADIVFELHKCNA